MQDMIRKRRLLIWQKKDSKQVAQTKKTRLSALPKGIQPELEVIDIRRIPPHTRPNVILPPSGELRRVLMDEVHKDDDILSVNGERYRLVAPERPTEEMLNDRLDITPDPGDGDAMYLAVPKPPPIRKIREGRMKGMSTGEGVDLMKKRLFNAINVTLNFLTGRRKKSSGKVKRPKDRGLPTFEETYPMPRVKPPKGQG